MHIETIRNYIPKNEQEQIDKIAMLEFAKSNSDALLRTNKVAHFTNSALILNEDMTKVLLVNHLIYKSWGWIGGHNDGNPNFLEVVINEAMEETGIKNVKPLFNDPVAIDNIYVPNHIKTGIYVGDHVHMNLTYLLKTSESEKLVVKADENSGVKWFDINDFLNYVTEERMIYIYKKLLDIINKIKN